MSDDGSVAVRWLERVKALVFFKSPHQPDTRWFFP